MASTTAPAYELDYRPSYLMATIAGLGVMLLYVLTISPSTAMWDASEYIAAAYTMSLPHPPGNPFFVLIGRVFSILPIAPHVAMRINMLAALSSAVAAAMWFLIAERVLVSWFAERWPRLIGGAFAAIIGATAFTVWNQSVVNEKVYTVGLAGLAIISWLMIRWSDDPDGPKADRLLVLVAFLLGLGWANHMAGLLAGPAAVVAVMVRRPATVLRWRLLLALVGALLLGMTPFLTQPIRTAHYPPINMGEPTGCMTELRADCTFSGTTWDRFWYNFNREQYGKPSLLDRQAPFFSGQVGMWVTYFRWQWLRDVHGQWRFAQGFLALIFFLLAVGGGVVHWRGDRRSFWYFGTFMASITIILIFYMNFKYGHSQAPHLGESVPREVRDRDYFYLFSFSAWGVWAALGLAAAWGWLAKLIGSDAVRLGASTIERPHRRSWMLAAPILAIGLIPFIANWGAASRAGETFTRDFAHDLLNSVEPYGILVTVGDNDTFPLWYAQEVEGIRRDVTVANTSLLGTDWYVRQLIRRPVYEYDREAGPAIYRDREWPVPSGPPLALSLNEADAVEPYVQIRQAMQFRAHGITATIRPGYLMRSDLLVLQMIRDSHPERPMHFSRTTSTYAHELGLAPYMVTQGLARKLMTEPVTPNDSIMFIPGEGHMNVARTRTLWNDVFLAPRSIAQRGDWVDRASVGIPYLYILTGGVLGEALERRGDVGAARDVYATARDVARATRLDGLFQFESALPTTPPFGDSPPRLPLPLESP